MDEKKALQKLSVHSKGLNSKFYVSVHYKELMARKTPQNRGKATRKFDLPELCWDPKSGARAAGLLN